MNSIKEMTFKVCIFGDKFVGKTTLGKRYLTNEFIKDLKMTMGAEIHVKFLKIENIRIVLQIWDFAGEDTFRFFLPLYAQGSDGGIFMFDTTNHDSLMHIDDWISVFRSGLEEDEKHIPIMMVGGKHDLIEKRACLKEEARELAKSHNLLDFIECSSKTGYNVELVFDTLTRVIMREKKLL